MNDQSRPGILGDNFGGAMDIMLGRAEGMDRINRTPAGVYWSFGALMLTSLLDMSALSVIYNVNFVISGDAVKTDKSVVVLVSFCASMAGYGFSMFFLYLLCLWFEQQERYSYVLAANNWATVLFSAFFMPVYVWNAIVPDSILAQMTQVSVLLFLIIGGVRLIFIPLNVNIGTAISYFFLTVWISIMFREIVKSLLGFAG